MFVCRGIIRQTTALIGLAASILGIIAYIVKVSMDYSRLKTLLEQNQKRDEEERSKAKENISNVEARLNARIEEIDRKDAAKFSELFNSRNKTNETLTELATTMKMMLQNFDNQFDDLKRRIDGIKEK